MSCKSIDYNDSSTLRGRQGDLSNLSGPFIIEKISGSSGITLERFYRSHHTGEQQVAHVVRVKKALNKKLVVRSEDDYKVIPAISPTDFSKRYNLDVVINANFYDENYSAIGHVISEGKSWKNTIPLNVSSSATFFCDKSLVCDLTSAGEGVLPSAFSGVSGYPVLFSNRSNKFISPTSERHPRTVIADSHSELFFIVTSGRAIDVARGKRMIGFTYFELGQLLDTLGVSNALNLDGGGSSQLIYRQKRINIRRATNPLKKPDQILSERKVPVLIGVKNLDSLEP